MMICKSKMIFWIFLCSPLIVKAKDEFDDFFEFSDDPHPTEVLIDEFAHTIQLANGLSTQLEDKVKESPANNEIETLTVQLNGTQRTVFHGNHLDTTSQPHLCQCGVNQTCVVPELACNCDAKLPVWQADLHMDQ